MKKLMLFLFLLTTVTTAQAQKISPMDFWNANHPEEQNISPFVELAQTLKEKINEGRVDWLMTKDKKEIHFSYVAEVENKKVNCVVVISDYKNDAIIGIKMDNETYTLFPYQESEKEVFQDLVEYVTMLDSKGITKTQLEKINTTLNSLENITK